jgi:hypothetical protein
MFKGAALYGRRDICCSLVNYETFYTNNKKVQLDLFGFLLPFSINRMIEDEYIGLKQLTNNGTRDAYLNPEQAAFVNRWGGS